MFKKKLHQYTVSVEVSQVGSHFDGYAFCPVVGCTRYRNEAFTSRSRLTPRKAASDAFNSLRKHYVRMHKKGK